MAVLSSNPQENVISPLAATNLSATVAQPEANGGTLTARQVLGNQSFNYDDDGSQLNEPSQHAVDRFSTPEAGTRPGVDQTAQAGTANQQSTSNELNQVIKNDDSNQGGDVKNDHDDQSGNNDDKNIDDNNASDDNDSADDRAADNSAKSDDRKDADDNDDDDDKGEADDGDGDDFNDDDVDDDDNDDDDSHADDSSASSDEGDDDDDAKDADDAKQSDSSADDDENDDVDNQAQKTQAQSPSLRDQIIGTKGDVYQSDDDFHQDQRNSPTADNKVDSGQQGSDDDDQSEGSDDDGSDDDSDDGNPDDESDDERFADSKEASSICSRLINSESTGAIQANTSGNLGNFGNSMLRENTNSVSVRSGIPVFEDDNDSDDDKDSEDDIDSFLFENGVDGTPLTQDSKISACRGVFQKKPFDDRYIRGFLFGRRRRRRSKRKSRRVGRKRKRRRRRRLRIRLRRRLRLRKRRRPRLPPRPLPPIVPSGPAVKPRLGKLI